MSADMEEIDEMLARCRADGDGIDVTDAAWLCDTIKALRKKVDDLHRSWPQDPAYVNAMPNANYPIRILESFRARCDEQWSTDTSGHEDWLCQVMNEANRERARILDRAIASLRAEARNSEDWK